MPQSKDVTNTVANKQQRSDAALTKVKELAREKSERAIEVLASIMEDATLSPAVRVTAAEALLNRGYGKPSQAVDIKQESMDWTAIHLEALRLHSDAVKQVEDGRRVTIEGHKVG